MIFVDRSRVEPPARLIARAAQRREHLSAFMTSQSADVRPDFDSQVFGEFRTLVIRLFHRKCAFCESPLTPMTHGDLEHFRPKANARQINGKTDRLHYYWLAYDWENFFLICEQCDANKRTTFPVLGERAGPETNPSLERALLLNPCLDRPERYLSFSDGGYVEPRPLPPSELEAFGGLHRGAVTIDVFGLNREPLVAARQILVELCKSALNRFAVGDKEAALTQLRRMVADDAPYAAVARQFIAQFRQSVSDTLIVNTDEIARTAAAISDAATHASEFQQGSRRPSRTAPREVRPTYITRVEIRNFRAVEDLDCEFSAAGRWKMLLGENATGKTTVLQGVALALMGQEFIERRFEPGSWLTRIPQKHSVRGSVRVHLSTESRPLEFHFDEHTVEVVHGAGGAPTFVRGYGTVRPVLKDARRETPARHVDNLFDDRSALPSGSAWLTKLRPRERTPAKRAIRDLLLLERDVTITAKGGKLLLPLHGGMFAADELSAGYRDVFNVVADIIAGFPGSLSDMQDAFGIVLIDEIGAHLHPRWKMQIVQSLKTCFPGVQFITTTHDPLCLRNLEDDEIIVMERIEGRVRATTSGLPSPVTMRVDQLLTSRYFGLQSTVDPALDKEAAEYYGLLSVTNRTPDEDRRVAELRARLSRVTALGATRRDQIVYELVDQFIAEELASGKRQADLEITDDLKTTVRAAWASARAEEENLP